MSYESKAEPIKIGYLMDFRLPEGFPTTYFEDLTQPFDLVFGKGVEQGLIDRPIEIVYREVEGLPKGSVKAVIDAYGELCDEGCLAVFGPNIGDNAIPTREAIEERFKVPASASPGPTSRSANGSSRSRWARTPTSRSSGPTCWPRAATPRSACSSSNPWSARPT